MEKELLKYFKSLKSLDGVDMNLDYLESTIGSYSLQISEKDEIVKEYVDGTALVDKEISLFKRCLFSPEENMENKAFYKLFKESIEAETEKDNLPDIEGIQDMVVISEAYIVQEKNTEAIYKIDLKIRYIK